jgi:uncharacterized protein
LTDNGFINDPRQVLSLGQELNVRVLSVDIDKKQISLSLKKDRPPKPQSKPQYKKPDNASYSSRSKNPQDRPKSGPYRPSGQKISERSNGPGYKKNFSQAQTRPLG